MAKKKRILIVEDDQSIRDAMTELMEMEGYESKQAANGQKALDLLATDKDFDLIILDMIMPVMNGDEFLSKISTPENPLATIPVLIVSATRGAWKKVMDTKRPAIKKPMDMEALLDKIKEMLEIKK